VICFVDMCVARMCVCARLCTCAMCMCSRWIGRVGNICVCMSAWIWSLFINNVLIILYSRFHPNRSHWSRFLTVSLRMRHQRLRRSVISFLCTTLCREAPRPQTVHVKHRSVFRKSCWQSAEWNSRRFKKMLMRGCVVKNSASKFRTRRVNSELTVTE